MVEENFVDEYGIPLPAAMIGIEHDGNEGLEEEEERILHGKWSRSIRKEKLNRDRKRRIKRIISELLITVILINMID